MKEQLNVAHKMASEQRKGLALLDDMDSDAEMLFKHFETLKRYRFNINQFNDQVVSAIRDEDEQMSHLLSSTHLQGAQMLLEDVYSGSEDMRKNLSELMDMTRRTIDGISTASANKASNDQGPFDASKVELGNDVFKTVT